MRTMTKLAVFSVMAALVGCGSAANDAATGAQASAPAASDPAAPSAPSANASDAGADAAQDTAAIDALIASGGDLTTDKKADADPVEQGAPSTKIVKSSTGSAFQCTYTDYSLTKVPEKFVALNPNADVLYPGSLVQGKSMAGGILDPIPVKRAPGTITLTLASGGGGPFFKTVDEVSLSSAIQAENEILAGYTGGTPAKFSYSFESIYSSQQLAVAVDANVNGTNWSAAASLSVDKDDEKSRVLIQFSQEFYTMAFDPPQGAAGVFAPSVTADDLAPYVAPGNPAVYVSSVTYGRIFYLLFESDASQMDLEAAVKGSYQGLAVGGSVSANASWKTTINGSSVKAYALGGDASLALGAVTGATQFDKIADFLTKGANFDKTNPGVPISYEIRNLADATQVKLALTTSYTAKNCVPAVMGCDGVMGSGKIADACGVCGGDGTSCTKSCGATFLQHKAGNGAYVNFDLPSGDHGATVTFPDGNYYGYGNALCNRVIWGNVVAVCNGTTGTWGLSGSESYSEDHWCTADKNASWSDSSGDSISCGWQP